MEHTRCIHSGCVFGFAFPLCICSLSFQLACILGGHHFVLATGLGIRLCYHRSLAHRISGFQNGSSTSLPIVAFLSLQGSPIERVSMHRYHHQFTDTGKDPHSPIKVLWYSHMGWVLNSRHCFEQHGGLKNVEDLRKQPFYRFLGRTKFLHPIALGGLLYVVGGFPFLVWGMGVRLVLVFHSILLVNSIGHIWGKKAWNTGDMSRNNWYQYSSMEWILVFVWCFFGFYHNHLQSYIIEQS